MNDQDYIRKAVELADGWTISGDWLYTPFGRDVIDGDFQSILCQAEIDALAAQLVRQVDAPPSPNPDYIRRTILGIWADSVSVIEFVGGTYEETAVDFEGGDRTMNTIKAIVDSGVLDKCPPHDLVGRSDGTAKCADCGELADVSETGAAR